MPYHEYNYNGKLVRRHYNGNKRYQKQQISQGELLEIEITSKRNHIIENQNLFLAALENLKNADQDWESWYDDDSNIPVIMHWLDDIEVKSVISKINNRIESVKEK